MATFNPAAGAPVARSVPAHGLKGSLKVASAIVAVTNALALNDIVNFFYLPAGATVRAVKLIASTPLDTNGAPTLTIDVGYAGHTADFLSQSLAGSSATGVDSVDVFATAYDVQLAADTLVFATIHAAGTTKVAGKLRLEITYTVDGLAS
ncbi:MAG TPA: hypothetical protein VGI30_05235 [Caulobacteraceae bacterium]|jgi:hypothetical protein